MAHRLIQSLATDFKPEKYHDTYRETVLELVHQKAEGKEIAVQPGEKEAAPVVDPMAALEAQLGRGQEGHRKAPAKKTTRKEDDPKGDSTAEDAKAS